MPQEISKARKRLLFREVNEGIARIARTLDSAKGAPFEFLCECGDPGCLARVTLTLAAYDELTRQGPVLAEGHAA
jgi:hypothetical protein